jgi:serine/threonine-protein kinase
MPFVEGQSLRDKLAKEGELPIGDAVRILRDVVDALTEAHAHGVVHRDIKPENILLRGRHALVTDFGVAKAVSEATGREQLTTAGVALGTPAYMAPEQASADPHVDHRVDIYAVGAVAYELLTGRPVFMGTTSQQVLSAHMTEVPQPVTKHRETVPPALEAVVMRCLEKKPADRFQSTEELLPQLEALLTPSGGITPTDTAPLAAGPVRRRRVAIVAVGTVVALGAIAVLVSLFMRSRSLVITISGITQVTTEPGVEFQPALSPDGDEVAFVAGPIVAPHLVIRSTANVPGGGQAQPADTSLQAVWFPAWSPDGDIVRFLACRSAESAECVWNETGKLGGVVRPVRMPQRATGWGVAWSPDGARVAFVVGDTIFASSAADTTPRRVAVHTGESWPYSLAWSPDESMIAYASGNPWWQWSYNLAPASLWVVDATGGEPREVVGDDFFNHSPAWLDARHLLFVSNRDGPRGVYVVEVGPQGRRGEPRAIPGVADPHSISYAMGTRKLAWARFTARQNIWSYPFEHSGPVSVRDGLPVTTGSPVNEAHDVSPDGRWLAFDSNRRGNMDLYKVPLPGGEPVALTADPGDEFDPTWSPDAQEIAFFTGHQDLRVMPADGGAQVIVADGAGWDDFPQWSPSGLDIAFLSTGHAGVWMVSRDSVGGAWHEAVQLTDFPSRPLDWTPDGRGVLCVSGGGSELLVVSRDRHVLWRYDLTAVNGLTLLWSVLQLGNAQYSWDGRVIYLAAVHRDGRQGIWAIPAAGGPARLVVAGDDPAALLPGEFSVGPDRLYLTVAQYESDIWVADLDWGC